MNLPTTDSVPLAVPPPRRAGHPRRWWRRGLRAGVAAGLSLLLAWACLPLVPLPASLFAAPPGGLRLEDRHGIPLRAMPGEDFVFTQELDMAEVPDSLVRATLAAEDKRFWTHPGIDPLAVTRAVRDCIRHGRPVSGASTLTQQLIKLAQPQPRPRTLRTKLVESIQALRLEQIWSKQQILTEYLARLNYGNQNVGCMAASRFYFGKSSRDLSVAEAAFLAGLPQAPSRLDPHRNFPQAQRRQHWILGRMRINGSLSHAEFDRAVRQPLSLEPPRRLFRAPHFTDFVLQTGAMDGADGPVRTTLDVRLQEYAELSLRRQLALLREHRAGQGAVVVLDTRTGDILALVGSADYFDGEEGQVNGAWARRSPGSALKPFTYLLAMEGGANPATIVDDLPVVFPTATGPFAPVNYDDRYYGPMRFREALANSLNVAAVKVLDSIGGARVLQERLRACGLTTLERSSDHYGLGLTLGNAEVRLLELANAYACLARLGTHRPWRILADAPPAPGQPILDPTAAWLIADILADNQARVRAFGLHSHLRFGFPVACKTGTSSDFRDNWAFGYTPEYTVGVWVGNFDGTAMRQVSGVAGAAPILHEVFEHLHRTHGTTWYPRPFTVVQRPIHPILGQLWDGPGSVQEWFAVRAQPGPMDPAALDEAGRVRLAVSYRDWVDSSDNWLGDRAVVDPARSPELPFRLLAPLPGTIVYLDPDLPQQGRRIPLRAEGGPASWSSASLEIVPAPSGPRALARAGRHQLKVRHDLTGEEQETWIEVREL